ncbi:P-loop containing nucleoside triphosphate hydrolase protein [Pavlovales sp. CCMP2436]|nr:P-loop containing nucleoside triphosphate hydrolase protein [Pavlovales sp. CCMP2436]
MATVEDGQLAPHAASIRIDRLIVEDFKSFRGKQTIGPFLDFTAVIGPNGAGKSNTMDAISFVLGVQSRDLRGKQLKDLIFRASDGKGGARRASVTLCLIVAKEERTLCRSISAAGSSEFYVDGKGVSAAAYERQLAQWCLNARSRNFLVFQGDVSEVAGKSPKELTALFERLSGSDALKPDYDEAVEKKVAAEEGTLSAYQKVCLLGEGGEEAFFLFVFFLLFSLIFFNK